MERREEEVKREEEERRRKKKRREGGRRGRVKRKKEKREEKEGEEGRVVMIYYEAIRKPRKLHSVALATIIMRGANSCTLTKVLKSPESKWKTTSFP